MRLSLDEESQNVAVSLGLLDQPGTQMVGTGPGAKFTNSLRV